ncbi:hypothetical protein AB0L82_35845 [Nocardia sp. NPDC052001]|uniref:hypothetical protein n=1 Tax=Nocardia sp. NPDC052001 TaxID=3154853 RepID=UPI003445C8B3
MSRASITPEGLVLAPIALLLYVGIGLYGIAIVCVVLVVVAISKRVGVRTGLLKLDAKGEIEDSYWKAVVPWAVGGVAFAAFLLVVGLIDAIAR